MTDRLLRRQEVIELVTSHGISKSEIVACFSNQIVKPVPKWRENQRAYYQESHVLEVFGLNKKKQ